MEQSGSVLDRESKRLRREDETDRLSNLPEALIDHILSFLPAENVVRTSVLSTRWRQVWTSVTSLQFEDPYCHKGRVKKKRIHSFSNFVDKVLLLHDNPVLHKFSLRCSSAIESSCVNLWITAVLRRKRALNLDVNYDKETFVFPSCLFRCDSLAGLKLNMSCRLRVPTQACFSRLKTMELVGVCLYANSCIQFNLPSVNVLRFVSCVWYNFKTVSVEAPALKYFAMCDPTFKLLLRGDVANNLVVGEAVESCTLRISGQSLTDLEYSFNIYQVWTHFILPQPSQIVNAAVISLRTWPQSPEDKQKLGMVSSPLLEKFVFLRCLTLSRDIIETLVQPSLSKKLPIFEKLTHLKVSSFVTLEPLTKFLHSCPILEHLTLSKSIGRWERGLYVHVPWCIVLYLRFIRLESFWAEEDGALSVVKFLLWKANVLDEMHIAFDGVRTSRRTRVENELLASPRGSSSAKLRFSSENIVRKDKRTSF